MARKTPPGPIVLDFDGTLAPFRLDPQAVRLGKAMYGALLRLSGKRRLAVVSGRPLSFLSSVTRGLPVTLIGSHGAESSEKALRLPRPPSVPKQVDRVLSEARNRLRVENKPFGRVVHFRSEPAERRKALSDLWFQRLRDVSTAEWEVMRGNAIVELRPRGVHKGSLLEPLRKVMGADLGAVLGDDQTDEDMFRCMKANELAVLVGESRPSYASVRLAGIQAVRAYLQALAASSPEYP